MSKTTIIAVMAIVAAGVIATLIVQSKAETASREKAARLQQQDQKLAELKAEQERFSNLVYHAAKPAAEDRSAQLARLRAEAAALKKQSSQLAKKSPSQPLPAADAPDTHPPEYWQQLHQLAGAKPTDARDIASAMLQYALDHQRRYPTSLDQVAPYLAKSHVVLSGTNRFEIIYQGSLAQVDGIPESSIAAVRDTKTFLTPDGKQARVYGMLPGLGQIITSDDNFQSWEAEHVISPPATSQPAR